MTPGMTPTPSSATISAYAFDPADLASGSAFFLNDDGGFFDQLSSAVTGAKGIDDYPSVDRHALALDATHTATAAFGAVRPSLGFVAGAILQTDKGQKDVADVRPGDRILTRDRGFRAVIWVAKKTVTVAAQIADPALRPVVIAEGALGPNLPDRDLQLCPDQGLMVEGPRTKLLFGTKEVLVPAAHLVGYPGIDHAPLAEVTYYHLMCATHEVIWADSIWTESFLASNPATMNIGATERAQLDTIFAQNGIAPAGLAAARRTLQRHEADLLLA